MRKKRPTIVCYAAEKSQWRSMKPMVGFVKSVTSLKWPSWTWILKRTNWLAKQLKHVESNVC